MINTDRSFTFVSPLDSVLIFQSDEQTRAFSLLGRKQTQNQKYFLNPEGKFRESK